MKQKYAFGESNLFRHTPSLLERIRFSIIGQDFIGGEIRFSHFKKALQKISTTQKALDAGCGTGDFSFYLAERFPSVAISAYDIDAKTIEENKETQKKMNILNIIFQQQNALSLHENEQYDFIYCIGTLIYFSKKDTFQIIRNLTAALEKGGHLYIDLPQKEFSEVAFFPESVYKNQLELLKKENRGDLYSFEEIIEILQQLQYEIVYSSKSFSFFGKFAWEFDKILREKKIGRFRYIFVPFLKLGARLDGITKHKKGCCFVVLARKTR